MPRWLDRLLPRLDADGEKAVVDLRDDEPDVEPVPVAVGADR